MSIKLKLHILLASMSCINIRYFDTNCLLAISIRLLYFVLQATCPLLLINKTINDVHNQQQTLAYTLLPNQQSFKLFFL